MEEGFVYLFESGSSQGGRYQLYKTFRVSGGNYSEIAVTPENLSHSGGGGGAPYIEIPDYFNGDLSARGEMYLVESEIPLSEHRLFTHPVEALVHKANVRGKWFYLTRPDLVDPDEERRSGPQILADYRRGRSVRLNRYDYKQVTLGGLRGMDVVRPHVPSEIRRRARRYRERLARFQAWFHDEERTREAFISQAVASVLNQDSDRESHVSERTWNRWKHQDTQAYRRHYFPVHYAAESLVYWMDASEVQEWLRDYNFGVEAHQDEADELFEEGIRLMHLSRQGAAFLERQVDEADSYWNLRTRLLSLKPEYVDYDRTRNNFLQFRKYSHVFFAIATELVPILVKKFGQSSLSRFIQAAGETVSAQVQRLRIRPNRLVPLQVGIADIDDLGTRLRSLPDARVSRGVITFFEVGNVAIAVWGLAYSQTLTDGLVNGVNTLGALLDFSSNAWIVTQTLERRLGQIAAGRLINRMILVSGIIDATLGTMNAVGAARRGNMSGAFGWSLFAMGGGIVAIGAGIRVVAYGARAVGVTTTVGSGGTAAIPGGGLIFAGLILEGIGLAIIYFCDDDELDDWMANCMFGTTPNGQSTQQQIQALNDIMCKFEVEAEYTTTEMRFRNHTRVTLKILPRVITEHTEIQFRRVGAHAEARWIEYLPGVGNEHSLTVGGAGSRHPRFTPAEPGRGVTIVREGNRITRVEVHFNYEMDIDRMSGEIELTLNNGTLQGYRRSFNLTRSIFD